MDVLSQPSIQVAASVHMLTMEQTPSMPLQYFGFTEDFYYAATGLHMVFVVTATAHVRGGS